MRSRAYGPEYKKYDVEFEVEWYTSVGEIIDHFIDGPLDIIEAIDYRFADKLRALEGEKDVIYDIPDERFTLTIKGSTRLSVPLPEDTEGMPEEDIEAETRMNAEHVLARELGGRIHPRDIRIVKLENPE